MSYKQEQTKALITRLNDAATEVDGEEFWSARDLQPIIGYTKWQNMEAVIDKAKTSCSNSGVDLTNHFTDSSKVITQGKGIERAIDDTLLSRHAANLVLMNCDPKKPNIALVQGYYSVTTNDYEQIIERTDELDRINQREEVTIAEKATSSLCLARNVKPPEIAIVKSEGDRIIFGGNTTRDMKDKYGIPYDRATADFLPKVTLSAKAFALNLTAHVVVENDLRGVEDITKCHQKSNQVVRNSALEQGVVFEDLPPAEDIKKVQTRIRKDQRKMLK